MKSIFTNKNIRFYTKINVLKAFIWSILLYGCECWTLTEDLERRLQAAEMWHIRRIMNTSWTEMKSKEEVMEMAWYKTSLLKIIRKRQLQFFGHINRANGQENQILSGKICGTKSRGRQRTKYTDSLINFVTRKESPNNELNNRTDDREDWKAGIADFCNRPVTWWYTVKSMTSLHVTESKGPSVR